MNITMIWDADYPWDVRVEKVCKSLIEAGHEVHLVCRNIAQQEQETLIDGIHIHRLPALKKISKALNAAISFPAFFSPYWLWQIYQVAKKTNANAILVRDLPMCPAGIAIAKWLKIPCLLDMAECYPEMLRCTWKFEGFKFRNFFLRNPLLADIVERYCLSRIDKVFVMIEESKNRLLQMGVPPEKIAQVSNTPTIEASERYSNSRAPASTPNLVYVGLINPSRGLDTVIEGAKILRDNGCTFHLTIAGSGKHFAHIQHLVKTYRLENQVKLLGWVDHKKLNKLFSTATVGLVPHHICTHWNNTIPNKLFDYMAAGIPVISTNVEPMQRIIESTRCGMVYTDWNPNHFAELIQSLISSPEKLIELGANGQTAVREKYNWDTDEIPLISAVASLDTSRSAA